MLTPDPKYFFPGCFRKGVINSSSVSGICWLPGSENLFLAAHSDGTLIVYDKEKDDVPFVPEEKAPTSPQAATARKLDEGLLVAKSVNSSNQKSNPVACWKLSHQSINAFSFSPDSKHLAVISEDGTLRIIDYLKEKYALGGCSFFPTFPFLFHSVAWTCGRCSLLTATDLGFSIYTQVTMAGLSAYAGRPTGSMF